MTDLLEESEALLEELPDAVTRRRLGERLTQAVLALKNAEYQINRIAALLDLSNCVEFGATAEQRSVMEEMLECVADVGLALEEADEEDALRSAVFEYEKTMPNAIAALDRAVRERWRFVAADRFQPLIGIGDLLTSMNVANNLGGRLADCGRRGLAGVNIGSVSDLLTTVRALLTDFEALQKERAAEIGDDEVGDFINALADKRATLAMVTPKVHGWLKEHQALERLGINPR